MTLDLFSGLGSLLGQPSFRPGSQSGGPIQFPRRRGSFGRRRSNARPIPPPPGQARAHQRRPGQADRQGRALPPAVRGRPEGVLMTILRAGVDQSLGTAGMFREARAREAGHIFACELLLHPFERAFRNAHDTADIAAARRHLARPPAEAAQILCGYAAAVLANRSHGALAARTERGRDLIGAAIDCLAGEGGWRR